MNATPPSTPAAPLVLVTGAAGHLGTAVTARLARDGARLVVTGRDADGLRARFPGLPDAQRVALDLRDGPATAAALSAALGTLGPLAGWCHLVGGFRMGEAVHETTDDTWDFLMETNARAFVHAARGVVPHLLAHGGGRIVAVAAAAAQAGTAGQGAYSASKSALVRLVESMSGELKARGVNVNAVLPTIIDTADNRRAMPGADPSRWVAPEALADVIAFLLSDAARAVHGAALPVTGLV